MRRSARILSATLLLILLPALALARPGGGHSFGGGSHGGGGGGHSFVDPVFREPLDDPLLLEW